MGLCSGRGSLGGQLIRCVYYDVTIAGAEWIIFNKPAAGSRRGGRRGAYGFAMQAISTSLAAQAHSLGVIQVSHPNGHVDYLCACTR